MISESTRFQIRLLLASMEHMCGVRYERPALIVNKKQRKLWPNRFRIDDRWIIVYDDSKSDLNPTDNEVYVIGLQ